MGLNLRAIRDCEMEFNNPAATFDFDEQSSPQLANSNKPMRDSLQADRAQNVDQLLLAITHSVTDVQPTDAFS